MLPWRRSTDDGDEITDDEGSAAIEFILVGVILLVPIVYLIIVLGSVQQHALGAEAAARHLARAIATAPDAQVADDRIAAISAAVTEEYGMDTLGVELECLAPAAACPDAGATLAVRVSSTVSLPFVPAVWGLDRVARIPVEAVSLQKVSRYWGTG